MSKIIISILFRVTNATRYNPVWWICTLCSDSSTGRGGKYIDRTLRTIITTSLHVDGITKDTIVFCTAYNS